MTSMVSLAGPGHRPLLLLLLLAVTGPSGVLAGMKLTGVYIDGTEHIEGMRGNESPGDIFHVDGANRFWCGMLFNTLKGLRGEDMATAETAAQDQFNMSIASTDAITAESHPVDGDHRAPVAGGDMIKVTGTTTPKLMQNTGGKLSFSYNPGNPNFYSFVSPSHPDGGFQLGEPFYEVAPWPEGSTTGTAWSYEFPWPEATYNGSYTIQVIFRANENGTTQGDETFVQCIDMLETNGAAALPAGCTTDDLSSLACGSIGSALLPPSEGAPNQPPQSSLPPGGSVVDTSMPAWLIAVIVILSLLAVGILVFLLWYCCFKEEEQKPQPVAQDEEAIIHKAPEPPAREPSSENNDSDSNIVQIQYTDPVPVDDPVPAPDDGEGSSEATTTPQSEPPGDGSQGRVFHFRYIANDPMPGEDGSEQAGGDTESEAGTLERGAI